eukprot:1583125-Pleurochrysis_carterae.AAC.1
MHCARAGGNLTLQLDQFSSMSNSNVVIQPSMKAVNDLRFDLEKYNASEAAAQVRFTEPSDAPIQAVNYLRRIANAHMRQLQRS